MGISADFGKLKYEEKETVGLLQVGTFLEYLDLMLYVHMAVFLTDLFFPPSEKGTASLLSSFALASAFLFRPIGALLFGWIGDHIGRKTTIIMTTLLMSLSCLLIASLPTYSQIGIFAAWMMIGIRALQGITSMGEMIGAEVYLTEILKGKIRYPLVASVDLAGVLGSFAALGIASLFTIFGSERWRLVFWAGAGIAVLGSIARTRLRESPDFVDMKNRLAKALEKNDQKEISHIEHITQNDSSRPSKEVFKTFLINTFLMCGGPSCFYFVYIYCGGFLKSNLGGTSEQVIHQNLIVSFVQLIGLLIYTYASYWIYPLKILKFKIFLFSAFVLVCPYWLINVSTPFELLIFQCTAILFAPSNAPAVPIFLTHFPILKRFTYMLWSFTLSRAFIFALTIFSIASITNTLGHWGWWIVLIPATIAFIFGIYHFENLEKSSKDYQENKKKTSNKIKKVNKISIAEEII